MSESPGSRPPTGRLRRGLSGRQVQMIAIAGTIGTGLFLGTGRSLAQGGPASMLLAYTIVGAIVYVALILLGELATQYPVAGSFNAYAARFVSPSYGFALAWNYWLNDAVSVASDLVAAQLVLEFWFPGTQYGWLVSLAFWIFLVGLNAIHVGAYGELEYWLSSLKVVTVVAFILVGTAVDLGLNPEREIIGFKNWSIPGAPFAGGFAGFARVFVTASFAYGGTESLGITAGETRDPSRTMPRVVKFVFFRILIFYVLSILIVGLNVPWDFPGLSNKSVVTSPFTLVFARAGSRTAASFMNAVILSSVLSAGNHALFAGTRVLYSLAQPLPSRGLHGTPRRLAPALFARTTAAGVPLPALLLTSSLSLVCVAASRIGSGVLWSFLQTLVGVSNQLAWLSIGLASMRFRKAWQVQGRREDEKRWSPRWTYGWGPGFVVCSTTFLILVQGWSAFVPFDPLDVLSLYAEIPLMVSMALGWYFFVERPRLVAARAFGAGAPTRSATTSGTRAMRETDPLLPLLPTTPDVYSSKGALTTTTTNGSGWGDLVDVSTVDLYADEYSPLIGAEMDESVDEHVLEEEEEETRLSRQKGALGWVWKAYYLIA